MNIVDWTDDDFIRVAERGDVPAIAALARGYEPKEVTDLEGLITKGLDNYFVEGNPAVGFIRAEPCGDKLLVTQIVVDKTHQRKGVGTRLLNAMDDIAATMGLTGVVNCGPKTPEVTKLYEKLGYKEIERIPDAWGEGVPAIVLFKEGKHV